MYSCRTAKNTSTNQSDPNWDRMMNKVVNETIDSLTKQGLIK